MSALAGAAAGILGLKGWAGFGFYLVAWLAVSGALLLRAGWPPTRFFKSTDAIVTDGILGGLQVGLRPRRVGGDGHAAHPTSLCAGPAVTLRGPVQSYILFWTYVAKRTP